MNSPPDRNDAEVADSIAPIRATDMPGTPDVRGVPDAEPDCPHCCQGFDAEAKLAQAQQEVDRLRRAIAGYTERSIQRPYSEAKLKRALSEGEHA